MTFDDRTAHRAPRTAHLAKGRSMDENAEFAELYTLTERVRLLIGGVAAGVAVIATGRLWLFPWLTHFAASAPCRTVWGINGATVLWWALFVGIPLMAAILIAATMGRRGARILREGQVPPRHEKVMRPTRIQRGGRARTIGYLHLLAWTPLLALAVWGGFQAAGMQQQQPRSAASCPAKTALPG